VEVNNM